MFFIISSIGFYLYTKEKTNIKKEFIPLIIISTITCIMFLAGILNFMKITGIILGVIGFYLAIEEIYYIIKNKRKLKIDFNLLIYLIMLCIFAYLLNDIKVIGYDNFSHWAIIVKDILINDKLPNFTSKVIIFKAYPPGTACFLYYVCTYIGSSEDIMLFAQSILILSSIYTLFALCTKENKINWLIAILSTIYLLLGNIFITDLLVDTVLPVMGIAALIIIEYYKEENNKGLIYSIPILSALILVKNSGIFFVIIDLIIWLIYYIKNNNIKQIFKTKYIFIILIPILLIFVWKVHTNLVFDNSNTSKHAMSLTNYINVFNNKTEEDIIYIFKTFINRMFSLSKENIIMIALLVGFLVLQIVSNKESRKNIKFLCLIFLFAYIIYQITLFFTYIFSMPLGEAKTLSSYTRYNRTILLFEFGIFIIGVLNFINSYNIKTNCKKYIIYFTTFFIIGLTISCAPNKIDVLYKRNKNNYNSIRNEIRYKILDIKNEYNVEEGKKYLIHIADNKTSNYSNYIYYVCKYEFMSTNIKVIKNFSELNNINQILNYNYLILLTTTEETNQIVNRFGGELDKHVFKIK